MNLVDPEKRIPTLAKEITDKPMADIAEVKISVFCKAILTDYADEVAELIAGRLVIAGCEAETAREAAEFIKRHAKRFNIA